jgi:translation elongation factor EF-Tu-like GTPase
VYTILLLAEETLNDHDVARIASLHDDDNVTVHVLVPADAEHNRLIEALDEVSLGNLRDALDDETPSPERAEQDAMHAVNESVALLTAAGLDAKGSITGSNPVPAAIEAVGQYDADEIIVVTPPHPVEDALHRDWASRLRDELKLPVLHVISGTDRVVR